MTSICHLSPRGQGQSRDLTILNIPFGIRRRFSGIRATEIEGSVIAPDLDAAGNVLTGQLNFDYSEIRSSSFSQAIPR